MECLGNYIDITIWYTTTLIAVYIPIWIFLLDQNFWKNNVFNVIDQRIIKDRIFNVWELIILLSLIFIFLGLSIFLNKLRPLCSIVLLCLSIVLLVYLSSIIITAYQRSYSEKKNRDRANILNKETNIQTRTSVLWSLEPTQKEAELIIKSFFEVLKNISCGVLRSNLLETFLFHTQNKETYQHLFTWYWEFSILKELLDQFFRAWSLEKANNMYDWRERDVITRVLEWFLVNINNRQLHWMTRIFQKHFDEFSLHNDYKKDIETAILRLILYSDQLINNTDFLKSFFSVNISFIINIDNFNKPEVTHIAKEFFQRLGKKIFRGNKDKEYNIWVDDICHFLLSWIDNITFFTLFTFRFIWYDPKNRVLSFSNHNNNFWLISQTYFWAWENGNDYIEQQREQEIKNAIILFDALYPMRIDDIHRYLQDCNDLLGSDSLHDDNKSRITRLQYCLNKIVELRK